jgi:hypothetical protein
LRVGREVNVKGVGVFDVDLRVVETLSRALGDVFGGFIYGGRVTV